MTDLSVLFTCFVALVFGIGPALMPANLGSPLTRVATGSAASLVITYLASFGIYALALPAVAHWLVLGLPLVIAVIRRNTLLELWADADVQRGMLAWLVLAAWLLGWQFTVVSYSGATWQVDWHEHFHRSRFFLEHWDPHHRFIGVFSLAARPPLVNAVTAELLALAGNKFTVYQAASLLLGSLVIWPACMVQRRMTRDGGPIHFGWVVLLLMGLPSLVQNGVFPWTKLCTAFLILMGVALLSTRSGGSAPRLAGWLSLTAGMLAHYSAGPWIVAMIVAELVRDPGNWRAIFNRQSLLIAAACILLFCTWLFWSIIHLGPAETFGSNTTITSGMGLTVHQRLENAANNLYYTTVPAVFRHVDDVKYLYHAEDPVVRLRDRYFISTQSSILMIAGLFGVLVAVALVWLERAQHRWSGARYWTILIGIGLVLGTIVHTEVSEPGVAHICLLPFAVLVVAWLAARVPAHPWLRRLLICSLIVDVLLGIVLHFAVQSLALLRWLHPAESDTELIQRCGLIARENLKAKQQITGPFIADLIGAQPAAFILLLTAVAGVIGIFRLRANRTPQKTSGQALCSIAGFPTSARQAVTSETKTAMAIFAVCLAFHFWGIQVGWSSKNLPGGETSQARTALSAYWIKAENSFSLAGPTSILGQPTSVPTEFPLYQWTAVIVSKLTNWNLTKAGRSVSIACFYFTLPAVFLLLARWQVPLRLRWLVLAIVVTCPLYIFYARAFLAETMALMFSVWFWVACERAVIERRKPWLAVAMVAGTVAGLVKFSTLLLCLLPVGAWAAARLWVMRRREWKSELAWIIAAVLGPLATLLWRQHFANANNAQNPLIEFMGPADSRFAAFGTIQSLFAPELWATTWRIVREELTWFPAILICTALSIWMGRNRRLSIMGCTATFGSVLVIFPLSYARHEYSYVANTLFLLLAMSLVLIAIFESRVSRWIAYTTLGLMLVGQAGRYLEHYYPVQQVVGSGGGDLGISLRLLTDPDDVVIIINQGSDSTTAYHTQRRALMLSNNTLGEQELAQKTLGLLRDRKIGALAVVGHPDNEQWFIDWASTRGIAREPLYMRSDARVYVRPERRAGLPLIVPDAFLYKQESGNGSAPRNLSATWLDVARLPPQEADFFSSMQPRPKLAWATFGPALDVSSSTPLYGAHPVTRLIFALPAGRHQLKASMQISEDAYRRDLQDFEASDGVEVRLSQIAPVKRALSIRQFNPRHNPEDRGPLRPLEFTFTLEQDGEVELYFGPGPANHYARDWLQLGPLTIESAL